ncbi:hypothetical protein H8356DRAFT_1712144 [Neocallimastix lanati (nom. inval.)]|nr:hypothetical protein H8356DRAFT_1712144 [Neocallimastix sp. JGI-2020a]
MMLQIYSCFIIVYLLIFINQIDASQITVDSESSLISALNSNNYNDIIIKNIITINSEIKSTNPNLNIKGDSSGSSAIQFNNHALFSEGEVLKFNDIDLLGNITINYHTVDFNNVNFFGNMTISRYDKDGGKVNIENSIFTLFGESGLSFLEINSYDAKLLNSKFYANPSFNSTGHLIRYYGGESKKFSLLVQESHFYGEYINTAIDVCFGNIKIINSEFHRCTSFYGAKGGSITIYNADTLVSKCLFKDSYTVSDGGTFFISQTDSFTAEDIKLQNVTARNSGSFVYVTSTSDRTTNTLLKNIVHIGSGRVFVPDFGMSGVIASVNNFASLEVENYYGEDFYSQTSVGAAFSGNGDPKISVKNLELKGVSGGATYGGGLLFNSFNPIFNGPEFKVDNCTLSDLSLYTERECSFLLWMDKGSATVNNCVVTNMKGYMGNLHYQNNESRVSLNNVHFSGMTSNMPSFLFNLDATQNNSYLYLNNVSVTNITSIGEIFRNNVSILKISNSKFINIHTCEQNHSCKNYELRAAILRVDNTGKTSITDTIFSNVNGAYGFSLSKFSQIEVTSSTFENCNLIDGIFLTNYYGFNVIGDLMVRDSIFRNINSTTGTILHIGKAYEPDDIQKVLFDNCQFNNNTAVKQGGVVFSISEFSSKNVTFNNCKFNNNTANLGNISYSYDIPSEPQFTNIENFEILKANIKNFVTNPSYIKLDPDSTKSIHTLSGEIIQDTISYNMYDAYNHLIEFSSEVDSTVLDELIFYSITTNDTYNVKLYGQTHGYCWNKTCSFSNFKAVGNPGKYQLNLNIITFGQYLAFQNNTSSSELIIKECPLSDSNLIYKNRENDYLKSCYIKSCNGGCFNGECIGDNICVCYTQKYTGANCNQKVSLKRNEIQDNIFSVLSYILILVSFLLMIGVIYYRENPNIKGGSVEFLIVILLGTIFNYFYVIALTQYRNIVNCVILLFLYNVGFSLVFGSILAKTLRVYKISQIINDLSSAVNQKYLYGLVIGLTLYHVIIILLYVLTDVKPMEIDTEFYNYYKCDYSRIKFANVSVNALVLIFGSIYAYFIRNFNRTFTEPLSVPVYVYSITSLLIEITYWINININAEDLIASIGILISMVTIIYYLYIIKFLRIASGTDDAIGPLMGIDVSKMQRLNSLHMSEFTHSKSDEHLPNSYELNSQADSQSYNSRASLLLNSDTNFVNRSPSKRFIRKDSNSSLLL